MNRLFLVKSRLLRVLQLLDLIEIHTGSAYTFQHKCLQFNSLLLHNTAITGTTRLLSVLHVSIQSTKGNIRLVQAIESSIRTCQCLIRPT